MSTTLTGWTESGNCNYTTLSCVIKQHEGNIKHQDAVDATKISLSGKSSITDSFIGPEAIRKRETGKIDQREYTKKLIDCIAYCQVGGITLRGADESDDSDNPGNFRRAVKLLSKHNTDFKIQFERRKKPKNNGCHQ